jgi:CRP/FNR family transcriptional regulator, cyclic AMP receptor protein
MLDARHRASLPLTECRGSGVPAALLAGTRHVEVPRGTVVISEGRPTHAWFVIETGALRISCTSRLGCTATLAVLGPGDVIAPTARGDLLAESRAIVDSVVLRIPTPTMELAIERDPALGPWIQRAQHRHVDRLRRRLASALSAGVRDRLLELLGDLASSHGTPVSGGVRIELPLPQEVLATMVGATRESVNRAVRSLESNGAIRRSKRGYVLVDRGSPTRTKR